MRGLVVPLTAEQRRTRMLWLAGEATLDMLDPFVDRSRLPSTYGYPGTFDRCCEIFYLLEDHNGGKDPTALDCADRWRRPGSSFVNRTADCIGGMAWCGGFDRYQPKRFHGGWINTDAMKEDATTKRSCFRQLSRPTPGCFVVFASGNGHHKGHIGGVVSVPTEFAPDEREWWHALGVVDVAARLGRANKRTTGLTWFRHDAIFVEPTLTP